VWTSRCFLAVGAVGVETERGEAALEFLHLGQRHRAFTAGEGVHELPAAADAVGEMAHREAIGERRIVARDRGEVLAEQ
jgi:hypothetical protein